jgi:hypothetical protein
MSRRETVSRKLEISGLIFLGRPICLADRAAAAVKIRGGEAATDRDYSSYKRYPRSPGDQLLTGGFFWQTQTSEITFKVNTNSGGAMCLYAVN